MRHFPKKSYPSILILVLILLLAPSAWAQDDTKDSSKSEDPPATPLAQNERIFRVGYDTVFDSLVGVIKEKGLFDHPHGKARVKKEKGKIKTPTFRYFRIVSARFPPEEHDYRDSYVISVSPLTSSGTDEKEDQTAKTQGKDVKVQIKRKFQVYDQEKRKWTKGDPSQERVGISTDDLFAAVEAKLVPQQMAAERSP